MNPTLVGIIKKASRSRDSEEQYFACRFTQLTQLHGPLMRPLSPRLCSGPEKQPPRSRVVPEPQALPRLVGASSARGHREATEGLCSAGLGELCAQAQTLEMDPLHRLDGRWSASPFGSLVPSPAGANRSSDK